jgi:outer membrane receptor protein involved in Fe transport
VPGVRSIFLCFFLLFLATPAALAAQRGSTLAGTVVDASGAPVAGATVSAGSSTAKTGADGTFSLTAAAGELEVQATADGFSVTTVKVAASAESTRLVLQPAPLEDKVLVTASRGTERLATGGSMTAVSSAEILNSGAGALDDALRATPGFSLFRRTSSRVSNPTTQGVTLRGVSGSGASRTLVLADGVPLNDPFGSWVYWNRVPQAAVDRVEIVRGATGDLYGADALGGVVQVLTFAPGHTRLRFTAEGGSLDTQRYSGFANTQYKGWYGEAAGEWLRSDGYIVTAEDVRGPVDVPADSDYETGFFGGGYNPGSWHAGVRVSLYAEDRNNGTPLQVNTTDWTQVAGEAGGGAGGGAWIARGSHGTQEYYQTFSAILGGAARSGERLTTKQTTPSRFTTASGQWTRAFGTVSALVGGEGRRTRSSIEELRYSITNVESGPFYGGGREATGALFGRISFVPVEPLTIVLGARGDFWKSTPSDTALPEHEAEFFSPRASAAWKVSETVSVHGAGYRSHRTPTLNELYRGFRVGAIETLPNPLLDPETLTGGEGGVMFNYGAFSLRATAFANQLENAITNVTIGTNLRERQNTDTVTARGIELEATYRLHSRWTFNGLLVGTRSRFAETPKQPEIEGNRVPQVPSFQVGGSVTYSDPIGFTGSVQMRAFGPQYDDDLNEFEMDKYGVVDLSASQQVLRGLNVFVAVENLFDKEYDTSLTSQLRTVGWPRTARFGVRVFLP